jgi:starch synthase (maltosyl-transferring)
MRSIYYVSPLLFRGRDDWAAMFRHARDLGFDGVLSAPLTSRAASCSLFVPTSPDRIDPGHGLGDSLDEALAWLAGTAGAVGLDVLLDLVVDRQAAPAEAGIHDPRRPVSDAGSCPAGWDDPTTAQDLHRQWTARLLRFSGLGIAGFRCLGLDRLPASSWMELLSAVRRQAPGLSFLAWTPGTDFAFRRGLSGFDAVFSSVAWWTPGDRWLVEESEIQARLAPQIAFPEPPFGRRIAHGTESSEIRRRKAVQALALAARFDALLVPAGFEFGATIPLDPVHGDGAGLGGLRQRASFYLSAEIRETNAALARRVGRSAGMFEVMSASKSPVVALVRHAGRAASDDELVVTLINRDLRKPAAAPLAAIAALAADHLPLRRGEAPVAEDFRLRPGEIVDLSGRRGAPIVVADPSVSAIVAAAEPRIAIEAISPVVDDGRFAVKRIVGETLVVEADIFADSHDPLSAALVWRSVDSGTWTEVPMTPVVNDRWRAELPLRRVGRHEFRVEAWRNPFAIFRHEFSKKHEARLDLALEIREGLQLVQDAGASTGKDDRTIRTELAALENRLRAAAPAEATDLLLANETSALMARADRRPFRARSRVHPVEAERRQAGFASWYEMFPRSQSGDPHRHGTFDDVIAQLPRVRDMGFDVLYFPPIHPIGSTNRKGRNNSLKAAPGDPGSPYAIGAAEGGHEAIHPELGTFEDFRRLVAAALEHGIELALDLAIQASPDHPWLHRHPGWFAWRPDGTIRYAENPPKKYEDIVNVDFYGPDAVPDLWSALRDIVQLWVDQGVRLFRVDNPHTKPFPFWEWLIADIRGRHPDVVFLSEAFTRPKVMYRLAKIGFSQSYTYFTWRDTREELEAYMTEITTTAPKDFFRPHFFVNTHDINPDFLQNAPRSAYMIRAALAATLSGLWGVYNGFELCEGRPDAKRKEYADSEKYEIRAWDWDRPGNIVREITLLNRIRRDNPALHSHLGLTLLPSSNSNVMVFEKAGPGRENVVFVAITLDPYNQQDSDIEVPLWRWGIPDHGAIDLEDLVTGRPFAWQGKWQRISLNPHALPFCIYRVR